MSVYPDGAGNVNASPRTNTPPVDPNAPIDPVVEMLGGGRIVAHRPDLALAVGSTTAGLLLSQFWFWSNSPTAKARDGWFYMTADEISDQTGMSRNEQVTARKVLLRLGLIEEDKRGVPMKIWFHVKKDRLLALLREYAETKSYLSEKPKDEHTEKPEDELTEKSNDDKTASYLAEKPKDRFRELRKIARGKTQSLVPEKPEDITDIPSETSSPMSLSSPEEADPEGIGNTGDEETKPVSLPDEAVLLWDAALVELKGRVNTPTFETHLRGLKPVSFAQAILTLSAPSAFTRGWVETRHLGLIEEVAGNLACEAVSVRFTTAQGGI